MGNENKTILLFSTKYYVKISRRTGKLCPDSTIVQWELPNQGIIGYSGGNRKNVAVKWV